MDVEALYREHAPRLLAFLRARLPAAVAEDVHHDVWVRAIDNDPGLAGDDFRRWLFRVATNAMTDYRRKASTRYERAGLTPDHPHPAADTGADGLEQDELVARLRACVDQLPEPYRAVVRGRFAGESPDETAVRLSIPRGTVDTRYFKAKERLKACTGADVT